MSASFQEILQALRQYWSEQGCSITEGYDIPMGAGTFHPNTFLRSLGPDPFNVAYAQPSRRPTDGRYGDNPNRLGRYYQFQVFMKPAPNSIQDLYLDSLSYLGLQRRSNDIRFVEDNWESPALGAWGLGWEVWCNGMEVTQFTYFQQVGGISCNPPSVEITYGCERLAMYLQQVDSVYDIIWNKHTSQTVTYGDLFHDQERELSYYNFEGSDTKAITSQLKRYAIVIRKLCHAKQPLAAYDQLLLASHSFNLLDARGALSVTARQQELLNLRKLSNQIAKTYVEKYTNS